MFIHTTKPLFAWNCLEDSPTLATLRQLLASIRDAKLLVALRAWRGKGRDDYAMHVLWGVFLLRRPTRATAKRCRN